MLYRRLRKVLASGASLALGLSVLIALSASGCSPANGKSASPVTPSSPATKVATLDRSAVPSEDLVQSWLDELKKFKATDDSLGTAGFVSDSLEYVVLIVRQDESFLAKAPAVVRQRAWDDLRLLLYLDLYQDKKLSPAWAEMLPSDELARRYDDETKSLIETAAQSGDFAQVYARIAQMHQAYDPSDHFQNFQLYVLHAAVQYRNVNNEGAAVETQSDEMMKKMKAYYKM